MARSAARAVLREPVQAAVYSHMTAFHARVRPAMTIYWPVSLHGVGGRIVRAVAHSSARIHRGAATTPSVCAVPRSAFDAEHRTHTRPTVRVRRDAHVTSMGLRAVSAGCMNGELQYADSASTESLLLLDDFKCNKQLSFESKLKSARSTVFRRVLIHALTSQGRGTL
eukprot:IDg9035t1